MKLTLLLLTVFCAALLVHANEDNLTELEIQELVNAYKDLNSNNGMNAPVSFWSFNELLQKVTFEKI